MGIKHDTNVFAMGEEIIAIYKTEVDDALEGHKKIKTAVLENADAEAELTRTMEGAQKKRVKLLQEEIEDLEELKKMRETASSVEEIIEYNKRIKETEGRVKTLKEATGKLAEEQEASAKAAKEQAEAQKKNVAVMDILNTLTFGYAGRLKEAFTQTMTLVKGLKAFKVALASTGIGLLVVAIGSLIAYFTQTQRGADALSRIFKAFGATVKVLVDRFAAFGETLVNAFKNPKQAIIDFGNTLKQFLINRVTDILNGFQGLGEAVQLLFEGQFKKAAQTAGKAALDLTTGFTVLGGVIKDNIDNFKDIGDEIAREAQKAYELEAALQRLIDAERDLSVVRAQSRAQIKELNLIAEDITKTENERVTAAQQALAIEQKLMAEREKLAAERVRITKEQLALGEVTDEQLDELAQAEIELANVREESLELQTTINNKINQIRESAKNQELQRLKAIEDAQKAARDLAIRMVEESAAHEQVVLDELFLQKLIGQQQYNEESLKIALIRIEQLSALEQEGSLEYERLQLERLKIQSEFAQKSIDIAKAEAEAKRIVLEDGFKKELLVEENKFLKKEQTEEDYLEAVRDINQRRVDDLLKLETEGTTAYQDLVNEKLRIDQEYADKVKELEEETEAKRKEEREKTIEAIEESFNTATELSNTVIDGEIEAAQARIERINEQQEAQKSAHEKRLEQLNEELALARTSDKERIKLKIKTEEELFKTNQAATERQIAEEKKRVANFKKAQLAIMTIQEAVAVGRAFAELGPVAGIVAAAALAIKFALLFNQIEEEQFNEGTDYVKRGKNKPGIDTIPARLTEGEAVIPVKQNMRNRELVKSLIRGNVDDYINNRYVIPRLTELMGGSKSKEQKFNDNNIVGAIKSQTRSAEKNSRKVIQTLERTKNRKRGVA